MKKIINKILSIFVIMLIGLSSIGNFAFAAGNTNFSLKVIELPQCMDGRDNDADGFTDYPSDQGCDTPQDESESNNGGGSSISVIAIYGKTFPNAKIKIFKDGEVITNTKSNKDGDFIQTISGFYLGRYAFGISAEDKSKNTTGIYNFSVNLRPGSFISVVGIYMQPTINLTRDIILSGDDVKIDGYGIVDSTVKIKIRNKNTGNEKTIENKKTDKNGYYFYQVDSSDLQPGNYEVSAITKTQNYETEESKKIDLKIEKDGTQINNSENYKHKIKCDINTDSNVDLIDFSILIFHWMSSDFKEGDFNEDGVIDIKDFSIMAYNWTGN